MAMTSEQAQTALDEIIATEWTPAVPIVTDGLNADSVAEPELVRRWAQITGQITMRADYFATGASSTIQNQRDTLLGIADDEGARIDLACKFFSNKYNPDAVEISADVWKYMRPDGTMQDSAVNPYPYERLLAFWWQCFVNARVLGVAPRYLMGDHPNNSDDWSAGQDAATDAFITAKWKLALTVMRSAFNAGAQPLDVMVYGQLFGLVFPDPHMSGWLSHNWYDPSDAVCQAATANLLANATADDKLALWVDWRTTNRTPASAYGMGVAVAGNDPAWTGHIGKIDLWIAWPTVFSEADSIEGTVAFLQGAAGIANPY